MKIKTLILIPLIAIISSANAVNLKSVFKSAVLNSNGTYTAKNVDETPEAVYNFAEKNNIEIINIKTKIEVIYGTEIEVVSEVTFKNNGDKISTRGVSANENANEVFYKKMDKLISKAQKGRIGTKTNVGYLNEGYLITPGTDAIWDFQYGIPQRKLELYLKERGYWYEIRKTDYFHYHSNEDMTLEFVVNPDLSMKRFNEQVLANKNHEKKEREDERNRIAEEKRIENEKTRKEAIEYHERKYVEGITNAKIKVNSNPQWTFKEFSNGFYIGEIRNGLREGYGEYYWKNTLPMEERSNGYNVSYTGAWKNDMFNGEGQLKFQVQIPGLLGGYMFCEYISTCNFINGSREGEGHLTTCKHNWDRVLYSNGKILRNYNEEDRNRIADERYQKRIEGEKVQACNNCVVDYDKTTYPHKETEFIMFTSDKPGIIVMKNGEKYKFWYDYKYHRSEPWSIIDQEGILFDDYKYFETFEDMINDLVKRCIEKKCK